MRRILPLILATILIMPQMLFAATAEDGYQLGRECYYDLLKSEEKKQQRANWESCITRFDEIYKKHPKSLRAADSLYTKGKMYEQLHEYSKNKNDLMTALTRYNSFVKEYPDHRLADDALYQIGTIRIDKLKQKDKGAKALNVILEKYPNGDMADDARVALEERGLPLKSSSNSEKNSNASVLLGVEHRSQDDLAQVAFFFSILPKYKSFTLDKDEENNKPRRLVIDFEQANLSNSLKKDINVASNLFERIRLAQKNESQTRAVLDLADAESYEILTLGENVIVSLNNKGLNKKEIKEKDTPISTPKIKEKNLKPLRAFPTKSDNSSWNIKRVVIDPGHGGKDPGAIGPHGTKEKDVALAISKRLANSLKKNLGVEVYLTRTRDKYLSLDERVEFANRKKADLFISVHANASTKKEAHGVETFFL
ncbi:N-acetylmuramoyl-L-alanine amidase, partial [bacterium]|nr:N-acetylmuramoyl-L-alanine amidase [bacterium]